MKDKGMFSRWFAAAIVFAAASGIMQAETAANYVAHEWGTFTSVQGGDGTLLSWRPLITSELPGFVYDWNKPGLNRGKVIGVKGSMVTLQRMETPVIYFYSKQPLAVDVSVDFPKGAITEWYPQTTQIGPSYPVSTNGPLDTVVGQSRAVWKNVLISPEAAILKPTLPADSSGSHYFAARETGANLVQMTAAQGEQFETEKFLFYRGAGSFPTPLRVTVDTNHVVSVANTTAEPLAHLFLVMIHDGKGAFALMDRVPGSNSIPWLSDSFRGNDWKHYPLPQFQTEIGAQVEAALVSEGLFADEARAMVNTWKSSWFTEEGDRVLYLLPRAWTDETLPITFSPKPDSLVRVMVGRAEILTPDSIAILTQALTSAPKDADSAKKVAQMELKRFGRFAEPALLLALKNISETNAMNLGQELLMQSLATTASR